MNELQFQNFIKELNQKRQQTIHPFVNKLFNYLINEKPNVDHPLLRASLQNSMAIADGYFMQIREVIKKNYEEGHFSQAQKEAIKKYLLELHQEYRDIHEHFKGLAWQLKQIHNQSLPIPSFEEQYKSFEIFPLDKKNEEEQSVWELTYSF
ncbi:hypothetical protein [Legionella jordanis]|uniref:Uncharacterized protein n=1 Tax=Legionella jordanis TaxID=456 RepID=A0A0W0VCW0_9GAMM|nr:hypothetical protein [Legionella jordanis]KTD17959.1 hypothetical protein Ljor_2265 [Legionella jordanis]RMX02348.1 hypothetical protein EAW55_08820 [Legionella jordanis]RMX15772.1 hypothetical protein EAS68_11715 [Legionella jordanis]VEH13949.1 Uncharacterised protein [Legionella jordanis]HAT8714327.1 hypothetical protein [Legionella jordanis]